jgi:thiol-disulfide isomerase/thioredoxin
MMKSTKLILPAILAIALATWAFYPAQNTGLNIGDIAPDIAQTSPDGKVYKLSDLRGKYVLIDFWASWCGPCRTENPNIVSVYEEFKDLKLKGSKGFTVYSVSLDGLVNRDGTPRQKDPKGDWTRAITNDKLSWPYHVSDLKGWYNEAAATYGVNSIPSNLLIDDKGVIIAKNLRGEALRRKMQTLVN